MKKLITGILLIALCICFAGCGHSHEWVVESTTPATCTQDGKTVYKCTGCNETKEEVIKGGHSWVDATCTTPKTCSKCGATEGEALGHTTTSGKCERCGQMITLGLGSTFKFDGLIITIGDSYSFAEVKNQFSEHYNASVIKLPVTVQNDTDKNRSLNMFSYKFFGPKGVQLDSVSAYFDDEVGWAGDLRSGASYTKSFYLLYESDGKYAIDFDNFTDHLTVEFEVKK